MKDIKAIIKPEMAGRTVRALQELTRFPGLTLLNVHGQGRGRGAGGKFVLDEDTLFFHDKTIIETVAPDDLALIIVDTIAKVAHTGTKGDGLIIVTDINQVVRIRTGETQNDAL